MSAQPYGAERVLRFGANNALVGILTEAARTLGDVGDDQRPAVLFLNSGILHRVGACRWHVQLARALSAVGFDCLRFDFSGIGDSEQRRDALPFQLSAVLETREAMDRLQRVTGSRRFVLMGLCSGADMAHATALLDERVVGLHLIDAWSYRTAAYYWHHYAARVFKASVWINALRVRLAILRRALQPPPATPEAPDVEYDLPTYTRVFPPRDRVASDLRVLLGRGVRLRLIWTSGIPDHNHRGQYASHFRDVPFGDALEEDHLPDADHILTGLEDQAAVTQHAVKWVTQQWPPVDVSARSLTTLETRMPRSAMLSICLLLLFSSACTTEKVPTAPATLGLRVAADLVGDRGNEFTIVLGVVNVCAFFPSSAGVGTASASVLVSGPAGEDVVAGPQLLTPVPHCIEAWNATGSNSVDITAALQGYSPGFVLDRIVRSTGDAGGSVWTTTLYDVTSATVTVSNTIGGSIWFKFTDADGNEVGGEGCTPGYWKQRHHFDSWPAAYAPTTLFGSVFANAFPGKTMVQVLSLKGGGLNALGRHSVAALLNAASSGVDYDLEVADVIAAFNAAYASGDRETITNQKDVFDMLNNQGCPLN